MSHLLVTHTVKDYATWKKGFDEHAEMRGPAGSKGGIVLRNADNPNEVTVLLEWDSVDNARAFAGSEDLKSIMELLGVVGPPEVRFLDDGTRTSI